MLKRMTDEEFIKYWEVRRVSKLRFILYQGIVFWAYPVLIFVTIIGLLTKTIDTELLWKTLPTRIFIWTVLGALFGLVMWALNEKKYKKLKNIDN